MVAGLDSVVTCASIKADIEPDVGSAADRNEAISLMEPMLIGDTRWLGPLRLIGGS